MASSSIPPKNDPLSLAFDRIKALDEDDQVKALITQCMMQHSMFGTILYFLEANGAKVLSRAFSDSVKNNAADLAANKNNIADIANMASAYVTGVMTHTVPHIRKHHPLGNEDKTPRGIVNLEPLVKVLTISILSSMPRRTLSRVTDEPPAELVDNVMKLMSSIMAAWKCDETREYYESIIRPTIRATTMAYVKRKREVGDL